MSESFANLDLEWKIKVTAEQYRILPNFVKTLEIWQKQANYWAQLIIQWVAENCGP